MTCCRSKSKWNFGSILRQDRQFAVMDSDLPDQNSRTWFLRLGRRRRSTERPAFSPGRNVDLHAIEIDMIHDFQVVKQSAESTAKLNFLIVNKWGRSGESR